MGIKEWVLRHELKKFLEGKEMGKYLNFLSGKKTYITGAISVIMAGLSLAGIGIPGVPVLGHDAAIQTILTGLIGIFLRKGVEGQAGK